MRYSGVAILITSAGFAIGVGSLWAESPASQGAPPAQPPAAAPAQPPSNPPPAPQAPPPPAPAAPQASAEPPSTQILGASDFPVVDLSRATPETLAKMRDPFQRPDVRAAGVIKSELERFATDQFEVLAIVTGPKQVRAMLRTPESKTIMISERVKIGTRNGFVRKITPFTILIREKILNVFGQEENVDVELKLKSNKPKDGAG